MADNDDIARMRIFRAQDAPGLVEAGCMDVRPYTPTQRAGMDKVMAAGMLGGDELKVITQIPGFAITNVWFKEGYQLPLHSHNADCMYYIVAGSIRLGTEELGPRDCFFVPSDVPYTYKVNEGGVELLEIRHNTHFDFINHTNGEAWWDRAAEETGKRVEAWKSAKRPVLNG